MNEEVTYQVLQECVDHGVREFIICAGSRNSSFVQALRVEERLETFYWPEERSGAFFALGKSRATGRPVAIVTTSGTAAGELFPAAMEAHYSGVPLILITADRPRRFRGTGAPQSAEQSHLFGHYTKISMDISHEAPCSLKEWDRQGPIHLNVCLEEPQKQPQFQGRSLLMANQEVPVADNASEQKTADFAYAHTILDQFFSRVKYPLIIVSTLQEEARDQVVRLLMKLKVPAMIEGISGVREDPRLAPYRIYRTDKVLESARGEDYPVDGVLRIGGIPTHRIWRDLEYLKDQVKVCSLSELHFSGLSWNRMVARGPIGEILRDYPCNHKFGEAEQFLKAEFKFKERLEELFAEEPQAEPSLIYGLSKIIESDAHIYLGNSLPIREWDLAAAREDKKWIINANRGVNGIDGQISTFLGMCRPDRANWGIFGDLTTLYDMAGCWILEQMNGTPVNIVVINNGGGKLFKRMYPYKEMLNLHGLNFRPLADFWGLNYTRWEKTPDLHQAAPRQFIEIIPNDDATTRFWARYAEVAQVPIEMPQKETS
ncbi:MAG: 2-succinyl-5-enolpyruvyl-6-hydroxy-3-cyclohexene-1-carboxylic-acid synthase [Parachlamydiaceae bacterium]